MKLLTLMCILLGGHVSADTFILTAEERAAQIEGLATWNKFADDGWTHLPREEAIRELSSGLRKTSPLRTTYTVPEKAEIHEKLRNAFLTIPGYAEYYRDRVLEAREQLEKVRAGTRTDMLEGTAAHHVLSAQGDCFGTLSLLPSAETIRVLGEFLDDHRGWRDPHPGMTETEREWLKIEVPNSYKAANALQFLPIVGKPFPKTKWRKDYSKEEIAIWKQWYDEIKEGRRTFRFEGDPVEYDLNGPAPKEKLERLALAEKRDGKREARHRGPEFAPSSEAQVPSQAPLVALLVACAAVLGSLVWYFRRANNS